MIVLNNKQCTIEEWFIKKHDLNLYRATIKRETDKAVLISYETLKGISQIWVPKSVLKEVDLTGQKKNYDKR